MVCKVKKKREFIKKFFPLLPGQAFSSLSSESLSLNSSNRDSPRKHTPHRQRALVNNQKPANTAEQWKSGAKQATNKAEEKAYEAEKKCAREAGQPVEGAEQSLDADEQVISGTLQANFGAEQA